MLFPILETSFISVTGGMLFRLLHLPLPGCWDPDGSSGLEAIYQETWSGRWNTRNCGLVIPWLHAGETLVYHCHSPEIFKQLLAMLLAYNFNNPVQLIGGNHNLPCTGLNPTTTVLGSIPGA